MSLDMEVLGKDLQTRFIQYCQDFDTGSVDNGMKVVPSTEGQRLFAEFLAEQAKAMGYEIFLAEEGENSFGLKISVKSNITDREVMPIALGAHLDAAGAKEGVPNSGIEVMVHEDYDGGDIHLKDDIVIGPAQFSGLEKYKGDTLFTSDGTTLLKGDDVAGVASIMSFLKYLSDNQDVEHGDIDVIFTYDEEVGLYGGLQLDSNLDTKAEVMMILDNEDGKLGVDTFNAAKAITEIKRKRLKETVSGEKYKINIVGQTAFPGYGKDEGLVDAFRTLPAVYEVLKSAGAVVSSVGGKGHEMIELEVIVNDGTDLSALSEIVDERFREHKTKGIREYADKPVTYKRIEDSASRKLVYDLEPFVEFVKSIPDELTAEQSEGNQPYLQPWVFENLGHGKVGVSSLLRAFETDQLDKLKQRVRDVVPESVIKDEYANMRDALVEGAPWLIDYAKSAMESAFEATGYTGELEMSPTRGGTEATVYTLTREFFFGKDGGRSIYTVNAGVMGGGFHSQREFTGLGGMKRAFMTMANFVEQVNQRDYTPPEPAGPPAE